MTRIMIIPNPMILPVVLVVRPMSTGRRQYYVYHIHLPQHLLHHHTIVHHPNHKSSVQPWHKSIDNNSFMNSTRSNNNSHTMPHMRYIRDDVKIISTIIIKMMMMMMIPPVAIFRTWDTHWNSIVVNRYPV